jgi:hypothetical protein
VLVVLDAADGRQVEVKFFSAHVLWVTIIGWLFRTAGCARLLQG